MIIGLILLVMYINELALLGNACLSHTDVCAGQQSVHIQEGPMYRVKGFPMSISCNVSGLKHSRIQEFAFSIYQPDKPQEIQIISTNDNSYTFAKYSTRVHEKNIVIERQSDTSVIFHINSLTVQDSGEYECYTPNTDAVYFGSYSAKTTVKVIEDTLVVSYSGHTSYSLSVGESLQLECQVSSQTFQHTHLSVTWYLRGSTDTRPIISLDRDLTVRPGPEFEHRYHSGFITMEKIEDSTYRLKITQVQQSESGEIYCQADEWIQDPDRSWMRICHRNSTGSNIVVKALDTAHFVTQIQIQKGALEEGDMMEVQCIIDAQNHPGHFFSMSWLRNNMVVAEIDHNGVQIVDDTNIKREKDGELRTVKKSKRVFVLTIQPVSVEDQGIYQCKGEQVEELETGSFTKRKSQLSHEETVHISTKESGLAVVMTKQLVNVTEGETLQISCSVSGAKGLLSVSWQHKKTTGSPFGDVITLSREGVMEAIGAQYQYRSLRTFRSNATDFILELSGTLVSDRGEYKCIVSEWSFESNGNLKRVNSQSQQGLVSVHSIDSLVKVGLKSRYVSVTVNSSITMICSVKAPKISLAVTWIFEPHNSTAQKNIICVDPTGSISCRAEQQDYQVETQVQESGTDFFLKVLRASMRHKGRYKCQIDAYDKNVQKTKKLSNSLAITVQRPDSDFSMDKSNVQLKATEGEQVKLNCSLGSGGLDHTFRYSLSWFFQRQDQSLSSVKLLTYSHDGRLQFLVSDPDLQHRLYFSRPTISVFHLSIMNSIPSDSGSYHCEVDQYQVDCQSKWERKASDKSGFTNVTVHSIENKLQVHKTNHFLNITDNTSFMVECEISSCSSEKSVFEVTWSRRQRDKQPLTIFTASRDGILHRAIPDKTLVYDRPSATRYTLTVPNVDVSDNGQYQCQVVEWLQTAANTWRKVAEDKSGELSVSVHVPAKALESNYSFGVTQSILIFLIFLLIVVVIYLGFKLWKTNSTSKKQKENLWAENMPLSGITETAESKKDSD
ncbi:hypothetical protein QTP86_016274 [Hemibagrus guttatus]|nr:hypothetical protein QTP86_016274 [Hemibagrus guttatus]